MSESVAPASQERGWRLVIPALLLFLVLPFMPLPPLHVALPVRQAIALLAPAMAACALVGWLAGGRMLLALAWTALVAWMLSIPMEEPVAYGFLIRGWAALLGASFGIVCIVARKQSFFVRALATVGVAMVAATAVVVVASPPNNGGLQEIIRGTYEVRNEAVLSQLRLSSETPWVREMRQKIPEYQMVFDSTIARVEALPASATTVFPAFLALQSLAALALAWALYHRVSRTRLGPPLSALRDFRFNDQLIWGLVAGIVIVILPTLADFRGVGMNLLLFFGALYVLRGLGVLTWFFAPRRVILAILVVLAVIRWEVFSILSLGLGLGDTWLDWRSRARPTT